MKDKNLEDRILAERHRTEWSMFDKRGPWVSIEHQIRLARKVRRLTALLCALR